MNSDLKKGRRDYSIIGLVLVAVFLLSQGGMYLIYFLTDGNISSLFGGLFTENDAYILLSGGIMYLFAIPIGLLLLHFLPSTQPQKERLGSQFFQWLLICFPIISAGALIGNLLSFLLSFGKASNPTDSLSGSVLAFNLFVLSSLRRFLKNFYSAALSFVIASDMEKKQPFCFLQPHLPYSTGICFSFFTHSESAFYLATFMCEQAS